MFLSDSESFIRICIKKGVKYFLRLFDEGFRLGYKARLQLGGASGQTLLSSVKQDTGLEPLQPPLVSCITPAMISLICCSFRWAIDTLFNVNFFFKFVFILSSLVFLFAHIILCKLNAKGKRKLSPQNKERKLSLYLGYEKKYTDFPDLELIWVIDNFFDLMGCNTLNCIKLVQFCNVGLNQ